MEDAVLSARCIVAHAENHNEYATQFSGRLNQQRDFRKKNSSNECIQEAQRIMVHSSPKM